jgi:serine/threonine protein kinase
MKEVADCNLQTYLDQTPFPESEKEALRSFYGSLCSAVEYLHRSKVRHKDLKPENILVKNNNILITDFGRLTPFVTPAPLISPYLQQTRI